VFASLIIATIMVAITTAMHFLAIAGLLGLLHRRVHGLSGDVRLSRQSLLLLGIVFGLFAAHTVEIWSYAVLYRSMGEFSTFEESLYFAASTFTTVGFGDVVIEGHWRLVAAIESANGFLLIGWSTAFLISVTARMRALEVEITERIEEKKAEAEEDAKSAGL
jgi:voltage-gated potassium channel Kch